MADFDDQTPSGVQPPLVVNPENRRLVELLTNHALTLQATVQALRMLITEVWANPEPVDLRETVRIEAWFRELAVKSLSAAADVGRCRREASP